MLLFCSSLQVCINYSNILIKVLSHPGPGWHILDILWLKSSVPLSFLHLTWMVVIDSSVLSAFPERGGLLCQWECFIGHGKWGKNLLQSSLEISVIQNAYSCLHVFSCGCPVCRNQKNEMPTLEQSWNFTGSLLREKWFNCSEHVEMKPIMWCS